MSVILKFGGSFFVNLIFYDFFRGQLKPRVQNWKQLFLILLFCAAALMLVNSFGSSLVNLIFGMSVLTAQVLLVFKDDYRKKAFLLLIGEAMALFSELATSLFFARLPLWQLLREEFHYTQEVERYIMGILSHILCWLVLHALKTCFLGMRYTMREHFPLSFFILPLSTALIYLGLFFGNEGAVWAQYSLKFGLIILPLADILLFYTINKLFFVSEKNREQQLMEQQAMLQQRYYKHLEEIDLGHRRYAHDLKNCMVSIAALAADGGNEEILSLLGDMEVELDTLTGKRYTSNPILNAILWEKSVLAKRQGVQMDIAAEENPGWACIAGKDLIVMAGNLLDNAIEAARQCAHGSVHAALHAQEHFLVMEVENTCLRPPAVKDGDKHSTPASTKPDAGNHGFGIANVRDTAQKYGGLLYIEQNGERFTAILTIAKSCLVINDGQDTQ
ncbi:MAG: GHKL domain-containing protein [Lachnospiraceae bacterium]|nr:GHKL domain-containing protein [Lachnospiraceae bacterium]